MDRVRAKRIVSELSGKTLGAWPVGKLIDNGKSALVVETKDRDGQKAALKIFDPDLVEEAGQKVQLGRIQREKSLIGKHHPHLIKILDGGHAEDVGYLYVVMDYCPGETIASALKRIPAENIRTILTQIASAARFLEEQKPPLAHRDIKPENVRLKDELSCAVLLDLGVTKLIGDPGGTDLATNHPFLGTRRYSPPSFLRRQEENTIKGWKAVTFYQLGAVLHDLLMRRPLFDGYEPEANLIEAVLHIVPEVRGTEEQQDLVRLCKACLQKDPALRLRLVDWGDFEFQPRPADDIALLRKRITDTQSGRSYAPTQANLDSEIRNKTKAIRTRIESQVRKECVSAGVFPPLTLRTATTTEPATCRFQISFPPKKGLSFVLTLIIDLSLLDSQTDTVELSYCAMGGSVEPAPPKGDVEFREFFAGTYDEQSLKKPLQQLLYALYDKAIAIDPAGISSSGTQIFLDSKKAPKRKRL